MDVRSVTLALPERRAHVVFADAAGVREGVIEGDAYGRVEAAAAPLLGALEVRLGGACHLAIDEVVLDALADEVRVRAGGEAHVFGGSAYASLGAAVAALARAVQAELRAPRPDPAGTPSDVAFWEFIYRTGGDGWELGRAAPPLDRWFAAHPPAGRRALVIGAGRGHDARMLARRGAQVVAIDFAEDAVAASRRLAAAEGVTLDVRRRDLFALPEDPDRYELVVEHTCFCAIDPARRAEYVEVVAEVLVPGGELVGLFFTHGRPGGPPFTTTRDEVEALLRRRFTVEHVEVPADSVASRKGQELLVVARRA